ncbi:unnamed protein product [Spirodela intermedia]|uniref:Uncharacterized protein n=1 Tax=Spirodela intermedia TaxID=51605 RepID=A0A7I8IFD8_SPIIN|nr:unnamed protein product [Spirodela intermedia]CAA6656520.1 unnamed protein product [Spirodela intermedia]
MASPDHLFALRNNFYLGQLRSLSPEEADERDSLVYRAYIAQGSYQLAIQDISDSASTSLQAVKFLARYLDPTENKEAVISSVKEWLNDPAIGNNSVLRLVAGIIFMHEQDYNEALKHTNHWADYAEKQLRIMQQIDEDHTLTQLATAWHDLAVAGSKIQEAYLIFQDFSEKFLMTGLVLNGKAVCCMHMGNFDEAETLLLDALTKDPRDPETLANLIVCTLHLGKSSTRYLSQLKLHHSKHMLVKRLSVAEEAFERALQSVA